MSERIGLCTDSNSQLPPELAERFDVEVVPLTVAVDGHDHLEGVDLDADAFYAHFADGHIPDVATSQPSPGRFQEAYGQLADRGCTSIVSIHLTASMSGTLNSARLAASGAAVPVHLVDSGTASFGISCCVWAAGLARDAGAPVERVVAAAEQLGLTIGTVFIVGVPRLTSGGGRAAGLDLEAADVPVLTMVAGQLAVLERVTDTEAAVDAMTRYVLDRPDRVNVAVGTSDASSRALAEALTERLDSEPAVIDLVQYRIGPSVGVHTGPGTAGLFVFSAP